MSEQGIQATLFDYFQDTEYFTIPEANELLLEHQNRDVNMESIRARIYEGVDKGLFERVGKGLYMVSRTGEDGSQSNCLLINGDGRDLSIFADNSLDAIVTDHPWADKKSLKGGNRNFADYELFEYTEEDWREKFRVLKSGAFCCEFMPEESATNYQYLFKIKEMARKAGMEYYAKVSWKKGDFVANTGRKSKNVEDVCFFTKGRARDLRPDAKKNKAEPGVEHFMSGAGGMLPTNFNYSPPSKKDRIHQAEKPVALLEEILSFVTLPGETVLDQFAGSGVLGEAALNTGRNSILIEKDENSFEKLAKRIESLGNISAGSDASKFLLKIGSEALVAMDAYKRTGDSEILKEVSENIKDNADIIEKVKGEIHTHSEIKDEDKNAILEVFNELEGTLSSVNSKNLSEANFEAPGLKILECSSKGDRRFSALFAKVTIKGKERSIEEFYQDAKRGEDGKKAGKSKPFSYIVDPFTGDKLPKEEASNLYKGLWITYLKNNPELVEYAAGYDDFNDMFKGKNTVNCQADVIRDFVKNEEAFVKNVKESYWYKNILSKKRTSLGEQNKSAENEIESSLISKKLDEKISSAKNRVENIGEHKENNNKRFERV